MYNKICVIYKVYKNIIEINDSSVHFFERQYFPSNVIMHCFNYRNDLERVLQ